MSVHSNLACQVCHPNITGYPHPQNTAASGRDYTLQYKETCKQCHPDQSKQLGDSLHTKALDGGNKNAPICADCHNPHTQLKVQKDSNGNPAPSEYATIAKICSNCHSTIYNEYAQSVHGKGVLENKNPDVPACTECHGVHTVVGPDTAQFRNGSPQMCGKCHTDPERMSKYGLSADVLNTYVSDFHGTTVTLFEKQSPDQITNKPVCYDCHGVHNISSIDDPQNGLQIKTNLLAACKKCHPDATTNFPDSWLSHYIPSPTHAPLVYYVQLFYTIFIPLVLGGMAFFVITDVVRRQINRRKPAAAVKE
jgi:predicted CXXCH cytochrome family protein